MNRNGRRIKSQIEILGDKSISHRALMISSISKGISRINNFLFSHDSISTLNCLRKLGVRIEVDNEKVLVYGNGLSSFKFYEGVLDARNSGTTMRLLSGILSGHKFKSIIDGDTSLRRRPMDRIIKPLSLMGAKIFAGREGKFCPIHIIGGKLNSISYKMEVDSAQVKSSILFAALYGDSTTKIYEKIKTRDHTERMLKYFGGKIEVNNEEISIKSSELISREVFIPGDISSASFFMALAGALKDSELLIKNVGINETRTGIIDVLKEMGVEVELLNVREDSFEKICDIKVYGAKELKPIKISGGIIPRLIDEIPIICVLCAFAKGESILENLSELRYKESDRIKSVVCEFKKLGIEIYELDDGIKIVGGKETKGGKVNSHNDHRIAMALTILSYISGENIEILNSECVDISFPDFYHKLKSIF